MSLCRGSSVPVLGSQGQPPANAECNFFPAARTCPAAVLRSQLRHGSEAQRVATLSLLGELARSDGQCQGWGHTAGAGAAGLNAGMGWKWCSCTREELQRAGPPAELTPCDDAQAVPSS